MTNALNRCASRTAVRFFAAILFATEGAAVDAPAAAVDRAVRLFGGHRLSTWSFVGGLGVADIDGDGLDDAAVGTQEGILVLRGTRSGSFAKELRIGAGRIQDVGLADFDNDGHLDLLADRPAARGLEVRFGRGGFEFGDPQAVSSTSAGVVTIADFTDDGLPDVLLYEGILIANADRTFDEQDAYFVGRVEWVGDLDSDGLLDVVANHSGNLYFFFGGGDGTFARGPVFSSRGDIASPAALADLNGDGDLELLVITSEGDLRVHSPTAPLVFSPFSFVAYPTRPEGFPVYSSPAQILVADFDQDSLLDVGVANYSRSDLSILFGRAGGGFDTSVLYGTSRRPRKLVSTRLGLGDALSGVVVQADGGPFVISSRELMGRNPQRVLVSTRAPFNPASIALGDIDGDSHLDIASIEGSLDNSGSIFVFFGTEQPGVTVPVVIDGGAQPHLVRVEDLNGDGFDDIVVSREETPYLSVLRGGPDRGSVGSIVWSGGNTLARSSDDLELADVNGDSHLDLVNADGFRSRLEILLGVGDGSFGEAATIGESQGDVAVADFDRDGALDFATGTVHGSVFVRLGDGAGGAGEPLEFVTGSQQILDLAAADANGDGRIDVVYSAEASREADSVGTLLNLERCFGDCNQDDSVTINELTVGVRRLLELDSVDCAAFDLDGDDLVVIADLIRAVRSALHGCSASLFKTPGLATLVDDTVFATTIRVADIDRDGIVDVVGTQDGGVGMAFGRGDGSFESPVWFGKGSGDLVLELADYDDDGRLDIVTSNSELLRGGRAIDDAAIVIMLQKSD